MQDFLAAAQANNTSIVIADPVYNPSTRELSTPQEVINLEPRSVELLELLCVMLVSHSQQSWSSKRFGKAALSLKTFWLIESAHCVQMQKHLPDSDATKILVTYPRKGYFLNPSSCPDNAEIENNVN